MPAKKKSKPTKRAKPKAKASRGSAGAKTARAQQKGNANMVCAECGGKFTTTIALADFGKEVGRKFPCPSCGAIYELISLQESRITVTVLARGETRTYGKTYDLSTLDYARPL